MGGAPIFSLFREALPVARAGLPREAESKADGTVVGIVRPTQVPNDEPLAGCDGATSIILFQMDVIHGLTLSEFDPDAVTTAYGPLAAGAFHYDCQESTQPVSPICLTVCNG